MWKLLVLLVLAVPVFSQELIATSGKTEYYLYKDSVHRIDNRVIFTAKWQSSKQKEISSVLANCDKRTYLIISTIKMRGKSTDAVVYKNPKIVQPIKNSAMWLLLDSICH